MPECSCTPPPEGLLRNSLLLRGALSRAGTASLALPGSPLLFESRALLLSLFPRIEPSSSRLSTFVAAAPPMPAAPLPPTPSTKRRTRAQPHPASA